MIDSPNQQATGRRIGWIWLLALAGLGGSLLFRLVFLGDARFAGDEAWLYTMARNTAEFDMFPFYGTHVTGSAVNVPGGTYHLLMAVPLLFTDSPMGPMVLTVVLGVLGLALGWRVFHREYGTMAALAVLALALFNPFSVLFGDRHWNPNILIPLGFLWIFLVIRAFRGEGRRTWMWLTALLVVAPQIHLSCTHLTLLTVAAVAVTRPARLPWRHVLVGFFIGFLTYGPYLVWDGLADFKNTRALLTHVAGSAASPWEAARAVYYQVLYGAGDYTYVIAKGNWFPMTEWGFYGGKGWSLMKDFLGLPGPSGYLWAGFLVVAVALSAGGHLALLGDQAVRLARMGRQAALKDPLATLCLLNLPLLAGTLLLARKAFYPHYSIVLFPLALVPAAWLISRLSGRALRWVLVPVVLGIAVTHGVLTSRVYQRDEAPVSYSVQREAAAVIMEDARGARVAVGFRVPRTRIGGYPMRVLASEYLGGRIHESSKSRIRYTIVPPHHAMADRAVKVWEVGSMWLVKTIR